MIYRSIGQLLDIPMSESAPLSEGAQRILDAATPLFAAKGYSGVSISDIATAVGGSKANIFHHFPNKKALYLEAIRSACGNLRYEYERMGAEAQHSGNRLGAMAGQRLQQMFDDPCAVGLLLREVFVGEKGIDRSLVAEILHQNFEQLVQQVREEQDRGHLRADIEPAFLAIVIIALNNFFFQSWTILQRFEEFRTFPAAADCAEATYDALSRGLTKP